MTRENGITDEDLFSVPELDDNPVDSDGSVVEGEN